MDIRTTSWLGHRALGDTGSKVICVSRENGYAEPLLEGGFLMTKF
jgi:hypothetical protein